MRILLLTILILPFGLNAQLIQPYLALEGYEASLEFAEQDFNSPKLAAIVVNIGLDISVDEIFFDFESGESNVFAYVFYEENDLSSFNMYPIVRVPFLGFQNALDFADLPPIEDELIEELVTGYSIDEGWLDSDIFAENMNEFEEYQILSSTSAEIELVALIPITDDEDPFLGEPFWGVQYSQNGIEAFICGMHAETEEMLCDVNPAMSVVDLGSINTEFGPNPSKDYLNIEYNFNILDTVTLIDIFGNQIEAEYEHSNNKLKLNTVSLNSGIYFVRIKADNYIYTLKFVKS